MLKFFSNIKNKIFKYSFFLVICCLFFGSGFILGSCKTTQKPLPIKYQYIPYPKYNGQLMDESTDVSTLPRLTLINQALILQSYIKKIIRRSDLIDFLYFNVNKNHQRYEEFKQYDLSNIDGLKKAYTDYAAPLEPTTDILK